MRRSRVRCLAKAPMLDTHILLAKPDGFALPRGPCFSPTIFWSLAKVYYAHAFQERPYY